jgi:transposase
MRRGMQGLALQVQESLKRDPHAGDLYIFRGRLRIPTQSGRGFRFEAGHRSDLIPATIPI